MNQAGIGVRTFVVVLAAVVLAGAGQATAQQKAFPQAEGFGAVSTGGRGGDVYHVTSLSDSSTPGTLRYGVENAPSSGRTIVFDVSGYVNLNSKLGVTRNNVTIAGQTAPGGGIGLTGNQFSIGADDIIVRHMRFRPAKYSGSRVDAVGINDQASEVIIDHASIMFSSDENFSIQGANITLQYSAVAWGLDPHSAGGLWEGPSNVTNHHNIWAHNHTRNPKARSNLLDWVNNVIYDPATRPRVDPDTGVLEYINGVAFIAGDSETPIDWAANYDGNYHINGPGDTDHKIIEKGRLDRNGNPNFSLYFGTNYADLDGDSVADGGPAARGDVVSGDYNFLSSPLATSMPVRLQSPSEAYDTVLAEFGATPWNRDEVDSYLYNDVVNRTGGLIRHAYDLTGVSNSGLGTLAAGVAPVDTDQDGMPDVWETKHGTPVGVANNNGDFDSDGYTDLEEYLNDLAAFKAVGPLEFVGAGRYADWGNWTADWEPSRLDDVEINIGTAVVDVVGQQAGTLLIAANPGDVGTLQVSSGWLEITDELVVGPGGSGTVQQDDGEVRVLNDGVTIENGTYNLAGGLLTTPRLSKGSGGTLSFTGGVLSADVVDFDLVVDGGTVSPGHSPGSTHFTGNATFHSGELLMELAGTGAGQYDTVVVDNALHAGGTLRVELTSGFVPVLGNTFDLLDFASVDGKFALELPALPDDLRWDVSQLYTAGVLAVRAIPEPASGVLLVLGAVAAIASARRRR